MLKDRRDDFDDNEEVDLTGMIHQYNEDNELRRKINEMKKQKESTSAQPAVDPNDSALMGNTFSMPKEDGRIPNIKADQNFEKTRVGFNDDSDKTLVIMDRKSKVDAKPENMYDDYSYVEPKNTTTSFSKVMEEDDDEDMEDLRSEIKNRKKKKDNNKDDFEEDEKAKRLNKIIMISIISVISIVLIVGIGFGVKTMFFNSDTSNSETDTKNTDKKTTTNKKNTDKTTTDKKNTDDIDDNSATITQLKTQLQTYQSQLDDVNARIVTAQSQVNLYQGKLDTITALKQSLDEKSTALNMADSELKKAKATKETACIADASSEACTNAKTALTKAEIAYASAETDHDTTQSAYDSEYNQTADYQGKLKAAQDNVKALNTQKTDLETKVADITTKLGKYN